MLVAGFGENPMKGKTLSCPGPVPGISLKRAGRERRCYLGRSPEKISRSDARRSPNFRHHRAAATGERDASRLFAARPGDPYGESAWIAGSSPAMTNEIAEVCLQNCARKKFEQEICSYSRTHIDNAKHSCSCYVLLCFRRTLPMHLVHNERTKLTAGWLNTLATAVVAAGFFAPVAAVMYGLSQLAIGTGYMLAVAAGCLGLGAALHMIGRAVLGRLIE
jgi:hypothetical protein